MAGTASSIHRAHSGSASSSKACEFSLNMEASKHISGIIALRSYLMLRPVDASISAAWSKELHRVTLRALGSSCHSSTVEQLLYRQWSRSMASLHLGTRDGHRASCAEGAWVQ